MSNDLPRQKSVLLKQSISTCSAGLTDGYKTKGLVQDAADAEERAEKAESLADAAQERMSLKEG